MMLSVYDLFDTCWGCKHYRHVVDSSGHVICTHPEFGSGWITHREEGWRDLGCSEQPKDCLKCPYEKRLSSVNSVTAEDATGICKKKQKLTEDSSIADVCSDFEDAELDFRLRRRAQTT